MVWWMRFKLGLPARKKDIQALHRDIPELFHNNFISLNKNCLRLTDFEMESSDSEFWNALQTWVSSYNKQQGQASDILQQNIQDCPANFCPLQQAKYDGNDTSLYKNKDKLKKQPTTNNSSEAILKLMYVGGGKDRKPPLDQFLDLVRKCHKDKDSSNISEVIITDPYVLKSVNHKGVGGGYDNFVAYLHALGINKETNCILKFFRGGNSKPREILERTLKKHFSLISIKSLDSELDFHDRFYFVRYKDGQLEGVFGPSLNGLRAESIILIGKLENDALKWLDTIFR